MKINFLKMSLQKKDLTNHLKNLLKTFFPHQKNSTDLLRNSLDKSLEKTYFCFSHINKKYYRDWETDRKSTRLNSSHLKLSRMPSSA